MGRKIIAVKAVEGSIDPTIPTPEMMQRFEPQLRSKEWIEQRLDVKVACACFLAFHLGVVTLVMASADSFAAVLHNATYLAVALFWSDLFTGILHIYLDHRRCDVGDFFDVIAYSFRYDHHAHPTNFFKESAFFPAGLGEIILKGTLSIVAFNHTMYYLGHMSQQGYLFSITWALTGTLCQVTHALAHDGIGSQNKRPIVSFLQRSGVILSPRGHGLHHKGDHDRNFCILNGWANPLLNAAAPAIFWAMRCAPGHFDEHAVPKAKESPAASS